MNYDVLILQPAGRMRRVDRQITLCLKHLNLLHQPVVVGNSPDDCIECTKEWHRQTCDMATANKEWLMSLTDQHKVYIAGPMTGLPQFNRPAFWRMEHLIKLSGAQVYTPARYGDDEFTYEELMRKGLVMVLLANTVVMLKDWDKSNGATTEYLVAMTVGNQVYHEK